jgi:hypothetical protein
LTAEPKNTRPASDSLEKAARRVEKEVRDIIQRLDREVVPAVRKESTRALRTASRQLARLADYMDERRGS